MSKPYRSDLRKIVTIGGSQGIILAPEALLKLGWNKGTYCWVLYHEDRIEITKHDVKQKFRGKN